MPLAVASGKPQDWARQGAPIRDAPVEQRARECDLHFLVLRVNVVHQGILWIRELVVGAHIDVVARGGLGREVGSSGQAATAHPWCHEKCHQHVLTILD